MSTGIDYGNGQTNIDKKNGIRYGVIPAQDLGQSWYDDSESDYGDPHCPHCGEELNTDNLEDCPHCGEEIDDADCYGESPLSWFVKTDKLTATQSGDDYDIFVISSEFYTRAPFCSPCAPGACYLRDADPMGELCYCFGHEWFDHGKAPYPVYRVADDSLVVAEQS